MLNEDDKNKFTDLHLGFARAVIDFEKSRRKQSKTFVTLLGAVWPSAKLLAEQVAIKKLAEQLFHFDLPGLKRNYEMEPWTAGIALALSGALVFEEAVEIIIERLLYPLIKLSNGYDLESITDETIKESISWYFDSWNMDAWPYEIIIPLHNFISEIDDLKIGCLTLQKSESVLKKYEWRIPKKENEDVRFFLTVEWKYYGGYIDENWNNLLNDLSDTITAIRLVLPDQHGFLSTGMGLSNLYLIPFLPRGRLFYQYKAALPVRVDSEKFGRKNYLNSSNWPALTDAHAQILNKYFLTKNNSLSELQFAIRRFNLSYSREADEDKIIDLVISLESCLLPKKVDELQYRLALRAATLLSHAVNPAYVRDTIKLTYDIRSQIIHNGAMFHEFSEKIDKAMSGYSIRSWNFIAELSELTRKIIIGLIECIHEEADTTVLPILENKDNPKKRKQLQKVVEVLDDQIIYGLMTSDQESLVEKEEADVKTVHQDNIKK